MTKKEYSEAELIEMLLSAKKSKKEKPALDKAILILVFIFIINLVVVTASFYITAKFGIEPSTTVTAWFAFACGEVWALAVLKINKRREETKRLKDEKIIRKEKEGEI